MGIAPFTWRIRPEYAGALLLLAPHGEAVEKTPTFCAGHYSALPRTTEGMGTLRPDPTLDEAQNIHRLNLPISGKELKTGRSWLGALTRPSTLFDSIGRRLADENPWVRAAAIGQLRKIEGGSLQQRRDLLMLAMNDPDPIVQSAAVAVFERSRDPKLYEEFARIFRDESYFSRMEMLFAREAGKKKSAVPRKDWAKPDGFEEFRDANLPAGSLRDRYAYALLHHDQPDFGTAVGILDLVKFKGAGPYGGSTPFQRYSEYLADGLKRSQLDSAVRTVLSQISDPGFRDRILDVIATRHDLASHPSARNWLDLALPRPASKPAQKAPVVVPGVQLDSANGDVRGVLSELSRQWDETARAKSVQPLPEAVPMRKTPNATERMLMQITEQKTFDSRDLELLSRAYQDPSLRARIRDRLRKEFFLESSADRLGQFGNERDLDALILRDFPLPEKGESDGTLQYLWRRNLAELDRRVVSGSGDMAAADRAGKLFSYLVESRSQEDHNRAGIAYWMIRAKDPEARRQAARSIAKQLEGERNPRAELAGALESGYHSPDPEVRSLIRAALNGREDLIRRYHLDAPDAPGPPAPKARVSSAASAPVPARPFEDPRAFSLRNPQLEDYSGSDNDFLLTYLSEEGQIRFGRAKKVKADHDRIVVHIRPSGSEEDSLVAIPFERTAFSNPRKHLNGFSPGSRIALKNKHHHGTFTVIGVLPDGRLICGEVLDENLTYQGIRVISPNELEEFRFLK